MLYALLILLIINIIVVAHELGHFLAARAVGIRPKEFVVGFGKTLMKREYKEAVFKLKLLPLGGYVNFETESFNKEPAYKRLFVFLGGISFNLLLAFLVCFVYALWNKYPMVDMGNIPNRPFDIVTALMYAWMSVQNTIYIIVTSVIEVFNCPSIHSLMGPIQLVTDGAGVLKNDINLFWPLLVLIDVNVMIINALPFPALDGARIIFATIEGITKWRTKHEEKIHLAGYICLAALILFLACKDFFFVIIKPLLS